MTRFTDVFTRRNHKVNLTFEEIIFMVDAMDRMDFLTVKEESQRESIVERLERSL